ncbi:hypothetical protein V8C26DRAFT_415285 [Trichoderma gracile]
MAKENYHQIPQSVPMHKCAFHVVSTCLYVSACVCMYVRIRDSMAVSAATLLQITHGILMTTGPVSMTIFACGDIGRMAWKLSLLHGHGN